MSAPTFPATRLTNPWWIPRFLGQIPLGIEPQHLRIMGFVALAMFFESFDMSLLGSVLKYLAEDFSLNEAQVGNFTGTIRLATFPAFFLIPFADRFGRRRMFLVSVIGMSLGTFLTAFSQTSAQFVAFQAISRGFIITASAVAFVIITEEFPAAHRGWGLGMLGAVGAIGHGFGALLFGFIDILPYGWRALYALGVVPILLVPFLRRGMKETSRFRRAAELDSGRSRHFLLRAIEPLVALAHRHPVQAGGVVVLGTLYAMGTIVAFQLLGKYVLDVRGWEPWQYSTMFIICGAVGIIGSPWAGRLGDRYGRRQVAAVMLLLFPAWVAAFYHGPDWVLPCAWVGMVFTAMSATVVIRALTNESFPTTRRGTASGVLSLMETAGASAGLFLYAFFMGFAEDQATVIAAMSAFAVISVAALPFFPRTHKLELESISGNTDS